MGPQWGSLRQLTKTQVHRLRPTPMAKQAPANRTCEGNSSVPITTNKMGATLAAL
jgi:hypothetical protein